MRTPLGPRPSGRSRCRRCRCPRRPPATVISARTPARSGTGMRSSARWSGRAMRAGRLRRAALASCRTPSRPSRSCAATRSRMSAARPPARRGRATMAAGVLGADVRPDAGMPGGDPGHVAEAAGGQPQQRAVLLGPRAGRVHQRRGDQVRDVGDHGDQAVVVLGGEDEDVCAQAHHDALAIGRRTRGRSRPVGVSTHIAPSNRSGSAPCRPICSEPAIGWPPTKRGWSASATMAVFTPLTSVTTASSRRCGSASRSCPPRRPRWRVRRRK